MLEKITTIELLEFKYTDSELNTNMEYRVEWNKILVIGSHHSSIYNTSNKCSQSGI